MNTLTDEMARLCDEITSLRVGRAELLDSIATANVARQKDVWAMMEGFTKSRVEMADATHAELGEFTNKVKDTVTELRQNVVALQTLMHNDIVGAHAVWHGTAPVEKPRRAASRASEPQSAARETDPVHEESGSESQPADVTPERTAYEPTPRGKKRRH
jgi:hypothetical protein